MVDVTFEIALFADVKAAIGRHAEDGDHLTKVGMKTRMSLIFSALVVILISMVWVIRDRGAGMDAVAAPAMAPEATIEIRTVAPALAATVTPAVAAPTVVAAAAVAATPTDSRTLVHMEADGTANYTARDGDTVSELAIALLGSDSKTHRDAIIAANPSLQKNPDRVLSGYNYTSGTLVDPSAAASDSTRDAKESAASANAGAASSSGADAAEAGTTAADKSQMPARTLTYTAQPGDNVAVLAASLLGADNKTNRDAVISGNPSLVRDPDRLLTGKNYTIVTTNGLAAAASAAPAAAPTSQPDADDAARMSVGRVLQYTAQPGDTVSKLAKVLLGEDTPANEAAIVANNWSLKQNPDHLEAGKIYWIAAPTK